MLYQAYTRKKPSFAPSVPSSWMAAALKVSVRYLLL